MCEPREQGNDLSRPFGAPSPEGHGETRRGAVILIRRGDPEISGAIAEGMAKGMAKEIGNDLSRPFGAPSPEGEGFGDRLTGEQIEVVEAEIDRQKIVAGLLRVATRNTKTQEDYDMLMIRARCEIQRYERPAGPLRRLGRRILGIYGLLCYGISLAYRQQDRILGSR